MSAKPCTQRQEVNHNLTSVKDEKSDKLNATYKLDQQVYCARKKVEELKHQGVAKYCLLWEQ